MADKAVSIVHCPISNLKLASGIAPVSQFHAAGIGVGLGTDGAASNNTLDLVAEMRVAALLAKVRADDAATMRAMDTLAMATIESARAIGLGDEIGSIESGKWANLACIDLGALNSQPVYDPVSQLVHAAAASQVSDTWVAGRQLLEQGRLTQHSEDSLRERCNEWRERIEDAREERR